MSSKRNMKAKMSEDCFDSPLKSSTNSSSSHLTPVSRISKSMSNAKLNTPRGMKQQSEILGEIDDNVMVTSASSPSLKLAPQNYQLKQALPQDDSENSGQRRKKTEKSSSKGCLSSSTTLKPSDNFMIHNQGEGVDQQDEDENLPMSQPQSTTQRTTTTTNKPQQHSKTTTNVISNVVGRKRHHDVNDENDAEVAATLSNHNHDHHHRPRLAKYSKCSPSRHYHVSERCASCPEKKKKVGKLDTFSTIDQEEEFELEEEAEEGMLYEDTYPLHQVSPKVQDTTSSNTSSALRSISTDPLCQPRDLFDAQPVSQPDPSTYSPSDGFAMKTKRGISLPSKPEDLCIDEEPTVASPARDVFPKLKQEWDQKLLRETLVRDHHSIGDYSRTGQLETVTGAKAGVVYISNSTFLNLLSGERRIEGNVEILDCRFPYEYQGGHVKGALNIWTEEQMLQRYFTKNAAWTKGATVLVFYCEFSSERAPRMFSKVRTVDRERNQYPHLHYPEMYVVKGGYKGFYNMPDRAQELCVPNRYLEMADKRYSEDLMKCKRETGFCRKEATRGKRSARKSVFGAPRLNE